ncbi:MAG: hypothetical protein NC420_15430 [Eubacterium sp.]|nr:hypothetical protein [Eubacterium sp.]
MTIMLLCACGNDMSADSGLSGTAAFDLPEDGCWVSGRYLKAKQADLIITENGEPIDMHTAAETISFEGISDGDEIRVYMGAVMETWPAQADVYAVEKLSNGDITDIPSKLLEQLTEFGWLESAEADGT